MSFVKAKIKAFCWHVTPQLEEYFQPSMEQNDVLDASLVYSSPLLSPLLFLSPFLKRYARSLEFQPEFIPMCILKACVFFWCKEIWELQCSFWNKIEALTFIVLWLLKQNSGWWVLKQLHSTCCNSTAPTKGWDCWLHNDVLTEAGKAEVHRKLFIQS